jgi:hypothetical protein
MSTLKCLILYFLLKVGILVVNFLLDLLFVALLLNAKGQRFISICQNWSLQTDLRSTLKCLIRYFFLKVRLLVAKFLLDLLFVASLLNAFYFVKFGDLRSTFKCLIIFFSKSWNTCHEVFVGFIVCGIIA